MSKWKKMKKSFFGKLKARNWVEEVYPPGSDIPSSFRMVYKVIMITSFSEFLGCTEDGQKELIVHKLSNLKDTIDDSIRNIREL